MSLGGLMSLRTDSYRDTLFQKKIEFEFHSTNKAVTLDFCSPFS